MQTFQRIFAKYKIAFFTFGIIAILIHMSRFQVINSITLLPVMAYWVFLGIVYKLSEKIFFAIALFFLVFSIPPFLMGNFDLTNTLSVWEFLFLILGLLQWILFDVIRPVLKR